MTRIPTLAAALTLGATLVTVPALVAHGASTDRHGYVTQSAGYTFDGTTGVLTCPADHPGKPAVLKVWSIPTEGRQVLVSTLPLKSACKGYPAVLPDGACQFDVSTDGKPTGWIAGHKGLCGTPPTTSTTSTTTGPTTPTSTETTTWPTSSTTATSPAPTMTAPPTTSPPPLTPTGTTSTTTAASTTSTATAPAPQRRTPPTRPTIAPTRATATCSDAPQASSSAAGQTASSSTSSSASCSASLTSTTLPLTGAGDVLGWTLAGLILVCVGTFGAVVGWRRR